MRVHDRTSSLNKPDITASWLANQMRAAFEPIVVQHFGEVMDEFVKTADRRWSLEGSFGRGTGEIPTGSACRIAGQEGMITRKSLF